MISPPYCYSKNENNLEDPQAKKILYDAIHHHTLQFLTENYFSGDKI